MPPPTAPLWSVRLPAPFSQNLCPCSPADLVDLALALQRGHSRGGVLAHRDCVQQARHGRRRRVALAGVPAALQHLHGEFGHCSGCALGRWAARPFGPPTCLYQCIKRALAHTPGWRARPGTESAAPLQGAPPAAGQSKAGHGQQQAAVMWGGAAAPTCRSSLGMMPRLSMGTGVGRQPLGTSTHSLRQQGPRMGQRCCQRVATVSRSPHTCLKRLKLLLPCWRSQAPTVLAPYSRPALSSASLPLTACAGSCTLPRGPDRHGG